MEEHDLSKELIIDRIDSYSKYCKSFNHKAFSYDKENKDIPVLNFDLKQYKDIDKAKDDIHNIIFSAIHSKYKEIKVVFIFDDNEKGIIITNYIVEKLKALVFYPLLFLSLKITIITKTNIEDDKFNNLLEKTNSLQVYDSFDLNFNKTSSYLINYKISKKDLDNLSTNILSCYNKHHKPIYLSLDDNENYSIQDLKTIKNHIHLICETMVNDISSNVYYHNNCYSPIIFNIFSNNEKPINFTYYSFPDKLKFKTNYNKQFKYILGKENYYFHHKAKRINYKCYEDNIYFFNLALSYRYIPRINDYLNTVLLTY